MKKNEINEIIRKKILELDESDQMKEFLLEIIMSELKNLDAARAKYTQEYTELAMELSKGED